MKIKIETNVLLNGVVEVRAYKEYEETKCVGVIDVKTKKKKRIFGS